MFVYFTVEIKNTKFIKGIERNRNVYYKYFKRMNTNTSFSIAILVNERWQSC